jgi:hypothetical protein
VQLPAGIGDGVQVLTGVPARQLALVIAWRITRPRFTLGGSLDGEPQVLVLVITSQGDEHWLTEADVVGLSGPAQASFFLPFSAGDEVLVSPSRSPGEVRYWDVTGRRLETVVTYGIHLFRTPEGEEIAVDARDLEPRSRI